MADQRSALKSKFEESSRLNNFGNVIERIHVQGFRCHKSTLIDVKSPITAFCGLNGVGKSTILHLAAAAYKTPGNQKNYSISNFIEKQRFDPAPFAEDASVEFIFHQPVSTGKRKIKQLTISRGENDWNGYDRRLVRPVLFIGIGTYLPKIEKADFVCRYPNEVSLLEELPIDSSSKEWICKILSRSYDSIFSQEYSLRKRKGKVNCVKQSDITYSESHMGFGEARSHYLVRALEDLPEKSLILIEEPEISLHPSAQYYFGCYLIDVCIRRGHQIFLTTHSESLLNSLPSESRIFLKKTEDGVETIEGVNASQAHSMMTDGTVRALKILVEDEGETSVAKIILEEIIRKQDPTFLSCIQVYPAGSCNEVKNTIKALKQTGLPVVGVLDADQNSSDSKVIYTLPGNNLEKTDRAPEKEIFFCSKVKSHLQEVHGLNLDNFQASLAGVNHHDWFSKLALRLNMREVALITELSKVYVSTLPELLRSSLVDQLKAACQ